MGELNLQTFSAQAALGGSFIALHQDTLAPFFINIANPAGLAGVKLTTFEVGGQGTFSKLSTSTNYQNKKSINFSYGSVAFPLKRFGGAAFGIMPYSSVGYKIVSTSENAVIGNITNTFEGDGGISKAFIGSGVKPFKNQYTKFIHSNYADTLIKYHKTSKYKFVKFKKQLLSEFSIGASANYLFGLINQTTKIIYPGSITFYNTKRQQSIQVNDFVFNFGAQSHFTIDSVKFGKTRRALKQKVSIGFGYFINTSSVINAKQTNLIYNYALDGFGFERPRDTILNAQSSKGSITLPLEMGLGLSVKKGEKLNVLLDFATTQWKDFKYFDSPSANFKNTFRISGGLNYVPNKLAYGSSNYIKRIHYRLGASYSDGYLDLKNTTIINYFVSAGLGLPFGIGRFDDVSMINISVQYGKMGTIKNNLLQEDYVRVLLGFTFNKRWFIKPKYD